MNKKAYEINGELVYGEWKVSFVASVNKAYNIVVSGRGKEYHGMSRFSRLKGVEEAVSAFKEYTDGAIKASKEMYDQIYKATVKEFEEEYGEMFRKFAERFSVNVDPDYGEIEFYDNETGIAFSGNDYLC